MEESEQTLPCISCGKRLNSIGGDGYNVPSRGQAFKTIGHSGSQVFDASWTVPEWLEVNVCDECLEKHRDWVLLVKPTNPRVKYEALPWQGRNDPRHPA